MKKLLILGGGTAGTIMANKMVAQLDTDQWQITVVDRDGEHHYQPGYLFVPFGIYTARDIVKPRRDYLPRGVDVVFSGIEVIEPDKNQVILSNGQVLGYDYLVIAVPIPANLRGFPVTVGVEISSIFTPSREPLPCRNICAPGRVAAS